MKTKQKTLILITRGFPYGLGESFINNELIELSKHFDKVNIFAQMDFFYDQFYDVDFIRKVPENVEYFKIKKVKNKLKLIFNPMFFKYFIMELIILLSKKQMSFYRLKCLSNYLIYSIHTYNEISSKKIFKGTLNYFYSYWLFHEPLVTLMLRNSFSGVSFSRAHGGDVFENLHHQNYLPFRKIYKNKLDAIFFISNTTLTSFKNYHTNKYNLFVSKLGIYENKNKPLKKTEIFKILSVSGIYDLKRLDLMILSLNKLDFKFEWHHFGTGPDELKIKNMAFNLLSKENVTYKFHGQKLNEELLDYLSQNYFDLLINTSTSEGVPVSMMECMSFGIPVLATNVGGTSEIVDENNGFLISENASSQEIANNLNIVYEMSYEEIVEKRKNAYNTWLKVYNAENNFKDLVQKIYSL